MQTDKVKPIVAVVVKGAMRAYYTSVVTQRSVKVMAPAPVGIVLSLSRVRTLVADRVSCW